MTPYSAAAASSGFTSVTTPVNAVSACWGSTGSGSIPNTEAPLTPLLYAQDFAMEFCGYQPGSTSATPPNVYKAFINTTACGTGTRADICPLQVVDIGTTPTSGGITVVYQIPNVWCDVASCQFAPSAACTAASCMIPQTSAGGYAGSNAPTPPTFSYFTSVPTRSANGTWSNNLATPMTETSNYTFFQQIKYIALSVTVMTNQSGTTTNEASSGTLINDVISLVNLDGPGD